ncbi:hypothetical protein CJU89_6557 [Yarrowia sp. B02]|nr:hypothetical protein CJU89_6557 [Yarrowia sp. B02]
MLLKIVTLLTAATAAFAGDCGEPQPASGRPKYSLHVIMHGKGAFDMKPLQIRDNALVYGLTQGFEYFEVEDAGSALANVVDPWNPPRQLFANVKTGQLEVLDHPAPPPGVNGGGFAYKGDGRVKEFSSYGTNQFYSCNSKTDPLHGGPTVYVFNGGYACPDPVKFSIGATLE